jgi:AmmeMemoRadiSam system radical SAM enzyme/AmmeMemoRadiSam system protein B/AmmeMemoRadiSam system protein A
MSQVILPPDELPGADGIKAGGWWHDAPDGRRVTCDLCPRGCTVADGDRGFCFVRQNLGGRMALTTYGRSTGFCIDPVEKKPLAHFYPGTAILSFGTAGCNLGCKFCQNWSISKSREIDLLSETAEPETIARAARELGCRSVAFTYNDPVIWAEYAIDTAKACHDLGIKTVAVTAGYITPAARPAFYAVMDAANVDLKGYTEQFYWKLTAGHLEPVLDTLRWIVRESNTWLEITNLMIPQANDSNEETARMCDWILKELGPDVPLHFTAYHPDFRLRDRGPTPLETLLRAHEIATRAGLHYVYTGNLSHPESECTYCPGCRRMVIQRNGYDLGRFELVGGECRFCGTPIAGHFDDQPGAWGARRMPVRIAKYASAAKISHRQEAPAMKPEDSAMQSLPRPMLDSSQEKRLFQAACQRVAAAVCNQPADPLERVLGDAASLPVCGAFVTLKRSGQLRSCCGMLGQPIPLSQALEHAAVRAAKDDPRFPPVSAAELTHLHLDVWLLWGLQPVEATGEDRVRAVTIGRHGLQISRGGNRGLLLPGVAVEHRLDARGFLNHVCLKAGLPAQAWLHNDTQLMTFEGYAIEGPLELPAGVCSAPQAHPNMTELLELADFCRGNLRALYVGATPSYYLSHGYDGDVCGLLLEVSLPGDARSLQLSTLALRNEKPLQATLYHLTETAAGLLRQRQLDPVALRKLDVKLTVLRDAVPHGPADNPDLAGFDSQQRAILASGSGRTAWIYDPQKPVEQLLTDALAAVRATDAQNAAVYSLATTCTGLRASAVYQPQEDAAAATRPAAVAGMFYPGEAGEIQRSLGAMLPAHVPPEPWPAVLVPHAGWVYSGRIAAATFARVKIPEQVIVIAPKHRAGGAAWAVAPHRVWSLPGGEVASDPNLAHRLAECISGLELDAVAHREEHAIEVHLPLIARLASHVRVVGITIGGGRFEALTQFGAQLAEVLSSMSPRPLLVISSDMNHYASDSETRRQDRKALAALESLDPEQLYQTVTQERISMCGMLPAVIVLETLRCLDTLHRFELVQYGTSADSSGDTARCVGYAGVLLG